MKALQHAWYFGLQVIARVLFILGFGIRVYHRERLPKAGGVLIVCNHQSFLDPILAAVGMPRAFHPMARETLFHPAPCGWVIRSLHAFPVRRATADLTAIREALRRLKGGAVVLVFPEGTRTRDGSIGRLQGGPATIAAHAGVPIVPMVIDGAFESWPKDRLLPRPHKVRVACGRPMSPEEAGAGDPETVMDRLRQQMVELQAELHRLRGR